MDITRRKMRYCHTEGHTDVCYSDDGKYIITCGNDGDIRMWCGLEDDDPNSQCVGETAFAVTFKDKHLFVATDTNKVQAYTCPELEKDGILCNFTAPVTDVVISKDGKKLIAGSRDMTIQICERSSSNYETLSGHTAPVLGVSVDPEMKYLASSSCDGTIRMWSLDTLKCIHIWSCLPACNSFTVAKCLGRTSWHPPSGKWIAIPDNLSIDMYERNSWGKFKSFSDSRVLKPFSIALFSPCGKYLAGSTISGEICIWNVIQGTCVSYTEHPRNYKITAMAWNPANDGTIAFCDSTGQLGTIEGCVSSDGMEEKISEEVTSCNFDEDEDNENVISLEKIKMSVSQPLHDFPELETDALSLKGDDDDAESKASVPSLKLQSPFQPSSSPVHLQHRYMVWNSIGIIRCFNTEEENSIDVEFHDSSLHHAIHLNNFLKHTLATLSEKALLLACEAQEPSPSKMVCVLLNSWDGTREWSVEFPEGEEVLAIACAKTWLAAATDVRNLRFFSIAGAQREVLSLPGPVVCLSAHENLLFAAYHHGSGLNFVLLSVERHSIETLVPFQPLPLTPQALLQWAGFSDEGTPCIVDSAGMLRILSAKGFWLPVCDTQSQVKGKSDHYFVIGLSEKYQNVRCILCKGSHYPQTTPRPTVVEIPLKIPLCEAASEKSSLEEDFWRTQTIVETLDTMCKFDTSYMREKETAEKTIKETIIKLFALACRNGLEQRALDLCRMMPSMQIKQLAMKYASKLGKMQLVERISEMCNQANSSLTPELNETSSRFIPTNKFSFHKKDASKVNKSKDEEDSFASSEDSAVGKENILIALKEKMSSPATTTLSLSQKKVNPFKKIAKTTSSANNEVNGSKDSVAEKKSPNAAAISTSTKVKQTGLWGKTPSIGGSSSKGPTFVQWFSKNLTSLQQEFPDIDRAALTRVGMKRFKEEVLKKGSGTKPKDNSQNSSENSQNSLAENSQNSLAENSQSLESEHSQEIEKDKNVPNSMVNESSECNSNNSLKETVPELKKRKLNEDVPETSNASKLAKFAFKK